MDEVSQDTQERFGENQILEVLTNADSTEEVAMIVDSTIDELTKVAKVAPEDTWIGWFGSFFDSADSDVTDYDDEEAEVEYDKTFNAKYRKGSRRRRL